MLVALASITTGLAVVSLLVWGAIHYDAFGVRARREAAEAKWEADTLAWLRSMKTPTGEQPIVTEV